MTVRKIALALCSVSLIVSAPASAAASAATEGAKAAAREGSLNRPMLELLDQQLPGQLAAPAKLAEHCGDNWWEFSLWQALACAYIKGKRQQ